MASRQLGQNDRGAAYLEFLIAFLPMFTMMLLLVQLALLGQAQLVVRHAANTALRSAIVAIDEDPRLYGGSERLVLRPDGARGSATAGGPLASLGLGSLPLRGDPRTRDIHLAGYVPLLAIAPTSSQIFTTRQTRSVSRALGGDSLTRAGFGLLYVMGAAAVTLPDGPGSTRHRTDFHGQRDVTVRVTFAYPCLIPLASRMMCDSWLELQTGFPLATTSDLYDRLRGGISTPEDLRAIDAAIDRVNRQRARLDRMEPRTEELEHAETPSLLWLTLANGTRFSVLQAEATLPLQSAPYPYPGESRR